MQIIEKGRIQDDGLRESFFQMGDYSFFIGRSWEIKEVRIGLGDGFIFQGFSFFFLDF